jgi:hypothetical protein
MNRKTQSGTDNVVKMGEIHGWVIDPLNFNQDFVNRYYGRSFKYTSAFNIPLDLKTIFTTQPFGSAMTWASKSVPLITSIVATDITT